MSILPKNEPMEKDITPKIFFLWGQSMHGKTYLARQFPDPVIINTDGNGKKIDTPHVDVYDFETFVEVLREIEEGKHTFKTIVIDLVDDIKTFLEEYVCKKYNVENLADAGFGKGYGDVKATWKRLMIRLTQLPYYVVFISHIVQITDDFNKDTTIDQPSLEQKYLNMTKGRTDVMIKCQKIGKNYLQICTEKRDVYKTTDITDDKLMVTLQNVKQLFDDNKPVIKDVNKKPIIEKKPVETIEENTDESNDEGHSDELLEVSKPLKKKSLLIKKEENE